jgi:hypothetical protein
MKRVALIGAVLAVFVMVALIGADSLVITFEAPTYHAGSIDGQNGWGGQNPPGLPINPAIDQTIVTNGVSAPASFGAQSWRISNAYTSGSFGDMPFSRSLANEAGETQALNGNGVLTFSGGTRQNHFEAQWAFASTDPMGVVEADSFLSVSPDRGDGARMSYIRLEDHPAGISVFFDDYQDAAPYGSLAAPAAGCGPEDTFVETLVASGLDRSDPHTVKLTMDFVDGPRNDVVRVYVDGSLRHTGTSWEDYFRWCTESGGGVPGDSAHDQSRTVDSLLFRVGGATGFFHPQNLGKGFLIDNLRLQSSTTECRNGDGEGDFNDQDGHGHHAHFHHGECEDGRGDVEEDNQNTGKHFESTSVDSATFRSDANSQTLTMIGSGLHDGLPVGFTMIALDNGDLAPGIFTLLLTDGYGFTGNLISGAIVIQ